MELGGGMIVEEAGADLCFYEGCLETRRRLQENDASHSDLLLYTCHRLLATTELLLRG